MNNYDVIVVGGGASGMMAAGRAASRGKRVLLIEKNKQLGEKLKITGGGRCNITNTEENIRVFMANYGKAEQFLYSPFSLFGVPETISFFEELGIPIVTQARKRAFPVTEKALDVYKALERYIKAGNVTILTNSRVSRIDCSAGHINAIVTDRGDYTAESYIIATGGMSHPETGSTGDGFEWLRDIGHTVSAPTPSIVPLAIKEPWVHSLAGVSLSFMKITFYIDGKKSFSKTGKLLFTHFGLSGPLILNSATKVGDLLHEGLVTASIDCYPDTDYPALEAKILSVFEENKNKDVKNVFDAIVPHGMIAAVFSLLPILTPETKVHSVTKEDRKALLNLLKNLPMTISGLMGYDRAVVADGGVLLTEINMKTFKSKKVDNMFVTGDLLHIPRPSGGFSLQMCWTSGYLAGNNV